VALCGFRDAKESLALLSALELEELEAPLAELRKEPDARGLRRFFELLYGLPQAQRARLVQGALRSGERLGGKALPPLCAEQLGLSLDWLPRLAALHPEDPGVIGALLLNVVELQPGEAIFLPAGNLHAYLEGTALELMASSDNVLRGGLTPKHVDVPELLRVLHFEPHRPEVLRGEPVGVDRQELVFETPTAEFCFSEVRLGGAHAREWQGGAGPEIVLCLEGPVRVCRGGKELELRKGQSLFCDAAGAPYDVRGSGRLARARVGRV
jgi:mannose-6-phosphate isomerase